ncbi:hypothetical protein J6590_045563 [Homalodisca vitripennis]|nr:hypothetical protein J6590_092187 [Homalodisca vitripennis]KAG8321497.1 hypothetical protein J6590_045563 [Homalodisca vitripennis]
MDHVESDAVADLTPEIWSNVSLKGSKNSRRRRTKELKTNLQRRFGIKDTENTKVSAIYVKRYSHCLMKCKIERITMLTDMIPNHGGATESSSHSAAMVSNQLKHDYTIRNSPTVIFNVGTPIPRNRHVNDVTATLQRCRPRQRTEPIPPQLIYGSKG